MSEEKVAAAEAGSGADPLALTAMIGRSPAVDDELVSYLRDQRHHLHEQLKQIHLDIFEKWLGVALRLATLCVGIGAAAGLCLMIWDAGHSSGLLVEPFSVPPDMAEKGLNGQAVASQILDKLTDMQNRTQSARPAQSYANNWGKDLKVEIPETGISVGEFQRFLREWLGHDTHITGEVWHTASGISIRARAGGSNGETVSGPDSELDSLIQKAAENVYRVTQPYRYANYLDRFYQDSGPPPVDAQARVDQAEAIYRRLTYDPSPAERAWAWNGLGTQAWSARRSDAAALAYYRRALALQPDFGVALSALQVWSWNYGYWEESAAVGKRYAKQVRNSQSVGLLAYLYGDFAETVHVAQETMDRDSAPSPAARAATLQFASLGYAGQHDLEGARRSLAQAPPPLSPFDRRRLATNEIRMLAALGDWLAIMTREPPIEKMVRDPTSGWDFNADITRMLRPALALAKAQVGDTAKAQTLIDTTPLDCYPCVVVHGQIAQAAHQPGQADIWFARAVRLAPSLPLAETQWGRALLEQAKADAAIEKFRLANKKGPRFADPLEGWGEALMAKNQSHRALAKFAEAEKYAPNWGRLHLKWGEALIYAGKKEAAKAQFARAAALGLTPSEKAELARQA